MTKNKANIEVAQNLVRSILSENFNQKIKAAALKSAAVKVLEAVPAVRARSKAGA